MQPYSFAYYFLDFPSWAPLPGPPPLSQCLASPIQWLRVLSLLTFLSMSCVPFSRGQSSDLQTMPRRVTRCLSHLSPPFLTNEVTILERWCSVSDGYRLDTPSLFLPVEPGVPSLLDLGLRPVSCLFSVLPLSLITLVSLLQHSRLPFHILLVLCILPRDLLPSSRSREQ